MTSNLFHQFFKDFAVFIAAILACLCFYFLQKKDQPLQKIIWVGYSLILCGVVLIFLVTLFNHIYYPTTWDFTAFYLYGKVGVFGHNYYSPVAFHTVFNSLKLPSNDYSGFLTEIADVGFLYPPNTIWLFNPLGYLSYNTALICWTILNLFFAAGCIYFLYKMFFKEFKYNGLILVIILFFLSPPVRNTIVFGQTNFILLFLLLLLYKYPHNRLSGITLALAFIVKPYMIIFGLFFIIRKQWKTVMYFAATFLVFSGLTFWAYGSTPFVSYIFNNPGKRLPDWVFSESINQSLHAVLIRMNLISAGNSYLYTLLSGGILFLAFVYVIYLLRSGLHDYAWMILLLCGLLIYPGTLSYYGVLLLFISFQLLDKNKSIGFDKMYLNAFAIGLIYYFASFSLFTLICLLLIFIVFKSMRQMRNHFSLLNKYRLLYGGECR